MRKRDIFFGSAFVMTSIFIWHNLQTWSMRLREMEQRTATVEETVRSFGFQASVGRHEWLESRVAALESSTAHQLKTCPPWREREDCPRIKDGSCAPAYPGRQSSITQPKCHGTGQSRYDGKSICSEWHSKWRNSLSYTECGLVSDLNDPYPPEHKEEYHHLHEHLISLLQKVKAILDEHNLTWWVEYSTALGALRDGRILPHDSDADIAIMAECRDEVKAALLKGLPKIDAWLELDFEERDPPELEMTARLNVSAGPTATKVDIYVYNRTEEGCMYMTASPAWQKEHLKMPGWAPHPDSWVFPLRPCHLKGIGEVPCSNHNAKRHMFYYGYVGAGENTCAKGRKSTHSALLNKGGLCERIGKGTQNTNPFRSCCDPSPVDP